jgi:Domain of unknown function (DUF4430)
VRRLGLPALLLLLALLPGCGLGEGEEREGSVELRITRDFGHELLDSARAESVSESDTVMRFLRRQNEVETSFGGRFVQAIDGLAGKGASGQEDWFFFVNGVESPRGAAEYELSPGDRIQWDFRDWSAAMRVSGIVGAFPEPFLNGVRGKRQAVRVECDDPDGEACDTVKERLRDLDIPATGAALGTSGTSNVIRVVVGPWKVVRIVQTTAPIEDGPAESGVFARFRDEGESLELLDEDGDARPAPEGTGLVAAMAPAEDEIVWVVTGVGERGVDRAASSLDARTLRDAFAVAATPGGPEKLPLESP